jgi:multidrug efflux pump subunit AcrB
MVGLIKWFSKNHVAGNFLMLAVILMGLTTWFKLKKEIFPETSVDAFLVRVPYPNAAPEEVERGIILPIEEAIQDLDGIDRITSTAAENYGIVVVQTETSFDVRDVMNDVKSRVDAIENLAEEAETPVLEEIFIKTQVLSVAISADTDERTLRQFAERLRDGLLAYTAPEPRSFSEKILRMIKKPPSITQVELANVRPYELSIEVSEDMLRSHGLTLEQVAMAVRASSLDLPGGSVRTDSGEILIRAEGKKYNAEDYRGITVLTKPDGSELKLEDVATIVDGFEEVDISSRFDGRPAVMVNVFRVGEEDTLEVVAAVKDYLEEARNEFPPSVTVEVWNDQSKMLKGRMDLLKRNGMWGLLLVFGVLAMFLRPSLAALVAIGIPVSFAGAIFMMPTVGISINMITLFGFILVLGIVVDDAIVVGENVYRRIRLGEHPREASWKGTHEVGVVVIFGVLTTMIAFTPMLGVSGVSGKIWRNIPWVVIPTLMFSLLQSKLVLPAHLALLKPTSKDDEHGWLMRFQRKFVDGLEGFSEKIYRPLLDKALHSRYVVLSIFVVVLMLVGTLVKGGFVKSGFFPEVEGDILSAKLTLPKGVPFETTVRAIKQIEEAAMRLDAKFKAEGKPLIVHLLSTSGSQPFKTGFTPGGIPTDTHYGEVTLELGAAENRPGSAKEIAAMWRNEAGPIPGVVELTFQSEATGGGNVFDLELSGNDLDQLEAATEYVKGALSGYQGVIDVADSSREGKRELKLKQLTESGKALGLRLADVARQLRQGFYGEEALRLQRGRDEVKVMVRFPRDERVSLEDVARMKIRTADGSEVPFTAVVDTEFGRGYDVIRRIDARRSIKITGDLDKTMENVNANEVVRKLTEEHLSQLRLKFPGVNYSFEGEQKDQRQSVSEIGMGALLALVAMYVLMAIPLRSYVQPLIIMSVIPFGIVGAVVGHIVMGMDLSIMSMCGIVALAGVVVNDSLVLVDYVNRRRREGMDVRTAAWEAGVRRFRPIMLTSLTTFAGLTPMLLETDMQARFLIPMAVSLSFGILFATLITLILIPCIYLMLDDFMKLMFKKETLDRWAEKAREDMAHEIEEEITPSAVG